MFEAFYGFDNTPFTRGVDTSALFSNNKAEEVLARSQVQNVGVNSLPAIPLTT